MVKTAERVDTYLQTLGELDEKLQVLAAIARVLAQKLDDSLSSDTAAIVMALPSLSKELRAVLNEIQERLQGDDELLEAIFGDPEVGDTAD